jgi:hypothetical protein
MGSKKPAFRLVLRPSSFVLILVLENRRENEPEAAAEITSIHPSAL